MSFTVNTSNTINHKRVMLANLRSGQRISYIVFEQGKPLWVKAEIIQIEIKRNYGRLRTKFGQRPWELLASKYEVVQG